MPSYDALKKLQQELIRKAQGGSAFIAPFTADPITDLTVYTAAVVGPPAVPAFIDLVDLTTLGYEDLGYLTDDGLGFENETSQSDVSSWQSISSTRSDLLTDTDTLTVVAQETKLLTIGLYTGVDTTGVTPDVDSGEVQIAKPTRPSARHYRVLGIAVDGEGDEEIFIGRFMPRAKVTGKTGQSYSKGDDPISYGVTFTAFEDSALGFATRYIFGGSGWKNLLTEMGFTP